MTVPTPPEDRPPPTLILRPHNYFARLSLESYFPRRATMEIELGSGDGAFLVRRAQLCPHHDFLGVERLLGRLRKSERKALRLGLPNVRLFSIEVGYFLDFMLPPGCVDTFHLYFPDPWPKRRHEKHRLVDPRFAALVRRALKSGGAIYFRTDAPPYHERILQAFSQGFSPIETPESLKQLPTAFEISFRARQIPIHYAAYRKD